VTSDGRVWELETGRQLDLLRAGFEPPLDWSPDGKRIAGARFDQNLQLSRLCVWNRETKSLTVSAPLRSRLDRVRFSPDSSRLLSVTSREVSIWDPSTLEMPDLTFSETDHESNRPAAKPMIDARWSADGKTICWATPTEIQVRDASAGFRHKNASASAGGGMLVAAKGDTQISIRPAPPTTLVFRPDSFVRWWHFSPQSKPWLDRDNFVKLESGELDRLKAAALDSPLADSETAYIDFLPRLAPNRENVAGYAVSRIFSKAGQTLRLCAGSDDTARIWLNGELVAQAFALR
jgi:hypothetical protein